jgi:NADH dehydrogenase [ubiquinone] 1 alpha subcomplex assembly factor 6
MADRNQPPALAETLRRHDRDRYLTTLFAPADRRDALIALYSFNFEVAKTREVVREPMLGQIRLQWWRDVLDEIYGGGRVRRHEVVDRLAEAIRRFALSRTHFERIIAARSADLDEVPPASLAALEAYAEDTSARLVWLALEILGVRTPAAFDIGRSVGTAWALIGTIRALPVHARWRWRTLPAALVEEAGLDERAFLELRPSPALSSIVGTIAAAASAHVRSAQSQSSAAPRAALPALLPAVLAHTYLGRFARAGNNPFDPALARTDTLASWRLALAAALGRF